ncbi:hypothetical protein E5S69_20750, partial [Cupriavidus necator]|nr:hypothetical protein [Cupriavidus necator]
MKSDIDKLRHVARAAVDVHDKLERSGHFPYGSPERKFLMDARGLLFDLADKFDGALAQAGEQTPVADLHSAIMNIRCVEPAEYQDAAVRMAYRIGHRDARHAAAELASSTPPADHREHARHMVAGAADGALTEHDAESLRMIAGWMDRDGIPDAAKLLRRLAAQPAADAPKLTAREMATLKDLRSLGEHRHFGVRVIVAEAMPIIDRLISGTHPAEPARADRQEWMGPVVIDRSHPNQAYVTYGFDDEAQCTQFIKATRYGSPVDRQGVALSDEEIERTFYPSGSATPN